MKNVFLVVALAATVAVGCGDDAGTTGGAGGGAGGAGGSGGVIGPLTWTTPGLTIVGDDCEFFVDEALVFEITIDGSNVVMADADPNSSLMATTDDYSPVDDAVLLTGSVINENFPPCKVDLQDAFELVLDDPDASLDENMTAQVTWDHVEEDVSDIPGDCAGEWFVDLPCAGEATFTLTQQLAAP